MKIKSKPVFKEAIQFTDPGQYPQLRKFIGDSCGPLQSRLDGAEWSIVIKTLEGDMRAELGDWIIKGLKGELYPCKPDIFEATYEVIEE